MVECPDEQSLPRAAFRAAATSQGKIGVCALQGPETIMRVFVERPKMRCRALFVATALVGLSHVVPTSAAGSGNQFLANLVGRLDRQGEWFACFSQQYDDAHLAAHPGQRVTFMKALVDAYFRTSSLAPANGSYMYQVSLAFRFRDRPGYFDRRCRMRRRKAERFRSRRRELRRPGRCIPSRDGGAAGSRGDHSQWRRPLGARTKG